MKLKSGATLLLLQGDVVLARYGRQFVTWNVDDSGYAYWGHYFDSFDKALKDFYRRCDDHATVEAY